MPDSSFEASTPLPVSAEAALAWHARPGAFTRLTPPWERVEVLEQTGGIDTGHVTLRVHTGPFAHLWEAEHYDFQPGRQFRDRQVRGPFARFDHRHMFEPAGPDACTLRDHIEYKLPFGAPGAWLGGPSVTTKLRRLFAWRHRITRDDLAAHAAWSGPPLRVVVAGGSGLLGSTLIPFLTAGGHTVETISLRRGPPPADALEGRDVVVHLAGENIAQGRWTPERKALLLASRLDTTRALSERLAGLRNPPRTLVTASAVGFYGDRGDEILTEASPPGDGFLADLCRAWEAAAEPARAAGLRVVHTRFGIVLTPAGGALHELLRPFLFGVGGPFGGGRQWMSWVALDDVLGALHHVIITPSLVGPVNVTASSPVRNAVFANTLGHVLERPSVVPLPGFIIRLLFGQMGEEALLYGQRVRPAALETSGYRFRFTELETALRHLLGRQA